MRFEKGIDEKYRRSVNDALERILAAGNVEQQRVAAAIVRSDMLLCVQPVSRVKASGVTGVIDAASTNSKIENEHLGLLEALGEVYIAIAEETIDTGGQRGCEGTLVHEGRHAYDFAQTISSLSYADINPLSISDPTLYELELAAHRTSGDYMIKVGAEEYLDEGLQLNILCRVDAGGCSVSDEGINCRLRDNYGLIPGTKEGPTASQLLGLGSK